MDKEQQEKSEFVSCELSALVKKINPDVIRLKYDCSEALRTEFVQIDFTNDFHKRISVTGDSLLSIAIDVLWHL